MKQFKCRASQVGKLLTDHAGKSYKEQYDDALAKKESFIKRLEEFKNKECKTALQIVNEKLPETEIEIKRLKPLINDVILSETTKSYIKEWYISELTGKQKEIKSKYLDRGNAMEEFAIARVAKYYNCKLEKNEIQLENEYFTGMFDTQTNDIVIDTKVPFDAFTFPFFETKIDNDYYAQLQIYMNLTGLRKASLCYCLENGSYEQINSLSYQISNKLKKEEVDINDWEEAEKQLSYDHLPDNLRIKVFEFDYDETFIEKAIQRVIEARDYLETIKIN